MLRQTPFSVNVPDSVRGDDVLRYKAAGDLAGCCLFSAVYFGLRERIHRVAPDFPRITAFAREVQQWLAAPDLAHKPKWPLEPRQTDALWPGTRHPDVLYAEDDALLQGDNTATRARDRFLLQQFSACETAPERVLLQRIEQAEERAREDEAQEEACTQVWREVMCARVQHDALSNFVAV